MWEVPYTFESISCHAEKYSKNPKTKKQVFENI